jgi:SOS-response transcriptional repressor LexA
VILHPENAGMKPMTYSPDEVQIQGVLKGLLRRY